MAPKNKYQMPDADLPDDKISDKNSDLRRRAEEMLLKQPGKLDKIPPGDVQRIFHELEVHQIELEMQNEELRRTQQDLEASCEKYFDLYDLAPVGYITLNEKGIILEANLTAAALLGKERRDIVRQPLVRFIYKEDQQVYHLCHKQLVETHTQQACEMRMVEKAGVPFWVRIDISTAQGIDDKSGTRAVIVDINQSKHIVEELRKAYDEMDLRVQERTKDLVVANQQLIREIEERKKAEESLLKALEEVEQLKDQLCEENLYLREEINLIHSHKDIVGNSESIRIVLKQIEQVAPTDSTVLIQGETGTGKELLAHAIHNVSSRKGRLMITVNCAALPPTLIESELFGREKGAFTGALSKQIGRFELADASTIFLDEIDALPLELQAKLLRVLESGEFERLGSPHAVKVDVRIISATNRDLARLVSKSGFREDLYYRLNVFQITVPPLRERREDIMPLVWSFVQEFSKRMGKRIESIPQKGAEALQTYPWPGNVRELRNVTERAMILTTGPVLHLDVPKIAQSAGADYFGTLEEVEKRYILEVLNATGWQVSGKDGAGEILGINPKTLESKMQKLGIQRGKKNA